MLIGSTPSGPGKWVVNINQAEFSEKIVRRSYEIPVVIDFWSPTCAPCKVLSPILEALAEKGRGRFLLAKVNVEENQMLAAQAGVRSIPSVKVVFQGGIIGEFAGALPQAQVEKFLDTYIPVGGDEPLEDDDVAMVRALIERKDLQRAGELVGRMLQADAENHALKLLAAEVMLLGKRTAEASRLLDGLKAQAALTDRVAAFRTWISWISEAPAAPAIPLADQASPTECNQAGLAHAALGQWDSALAALFQSVRRDLGFQDQWARKTMVAIFLILGREHAVAEAWRRKLSAILY